MSIYTDWASLVIRSTVYNYHGPLDIREGLEHFSSVSCTTAGNSPYPELIRVVHFFSNIFFPYTLFVRKLTQGPTNK